MGIHGWNSLLISEGWLPEKTRSDYGEASRLWSSILEDSLGSELWNRIETISPNAEIHIDGNGLSFFLQSVAVSRRFNQVIKPSQKKYSNFSWSCLEDYQIRELLPTFCPLLLLHEVTKEFIEALARGGNGSKRKLIVYWDGDDRYVFKHETRKLRLSSIDTEWSNMQQYCLTGRMPPTSKFQCVEYDFPKNALFTTQVKHTMENSGLATMVFCDEEADHIIARAASLSSNAFVLGNDSDFCFFCNINYIPIYTLGLSLNGCLSGVVLRRSILAESLQLPDEAAIVELAMLMGNDYIVPSQAKLNDVGELYTSTNRRKVSYSDLVDFLNRMGSGFRLTSISEDTEEVIRFVRALYNLEDMSEFEYAKESKDFLESETSDDNDLTRITSSLIPVVPDEVNLELADIRPLADSSVTDAVIRCLQDYVDQMNSSEVDTRKNQVISQTQLDAFKTHYHTSPNHSNFVVSTEDRYGRPHWEDVYAAHIIEKVVAYSIKSSPRSHVVRLSPPYAIFNQHQYHLTLSRKKTEKIAVKVDDVIKEKENNECEGLSHHVHLPVDDFEEQILASVERNRVTIIQGETGCGKSTRIPCMLLKNPPANGMSATSKLFIAQPRRIAAKALVEHLRKSEPDLRDQIALRMGHGVKEYEGSETRAWFVTTGYLVRLMSCYPERFDKVSYIIIDEVHERSVSTDLLCLLCRRMLETNKTVKLILMSATLAAALYQNYFDVLEPPIKVGARRFPVEEIYIDDIETRMKLPKAQRLALEAISKECLKMKCSRTPSLSYMEKLYTLVTYLATSVGTPGSSVLIFVPGMQDIIQMTEMIELVYIPNVKFIVFPIHSDIPFEDQMTAFAPTNANEVKIIIATNSAESSVTIPDVDHVICLGLCKQIVYNEASHRQILEPTWISRASAEQRKGRAGRLRPGTVYRIYPKLVFENWMEEFEPGEISRMPLDSVILMLKVMLPLETTTDLLQDCIEPPDIKNILRSFSSLHQSHFITRDDEDFDVTTLGSFVSSIGIDLALGSLIGLGIQFGVGAEAIQMAAILSFPKTPWIISNPLVHEPKDYNEKTVKTYVSKCHFDSNLFSEPLSVMNLLFEYVAVKDKNKWCMYYGIHQTRLRRLDAVYRNLRCRVAEFCRVDESQLKVEAPPNRMPHSKVNILRIIQVWVFHDTMIKLDPTKTLLNCVTDGGVTLKLDNKDADVKATHFGQLLKAGRHPFTLSTVSQITQKGKFTINPAAPFTVEGIESRLLSYASEKGFTVAGIQWNNISFVYVRDSLLETPELDDMLKRLNLLESRHLWTMYESSKKRRGALERPCGCWTLLTDENGYRDECLGWKQFTNPDNQAPKMSWGLYSFKSIWVRCRWNATYCEGKCAFEIATTSSSVEKVSVLDMNDLFASSTANVTSSKSFELRRLILPTGSNSPLSFHASEDKTSAAKLETSSWHRPLIRCIPESARLLSVIASGRRNEHVIRFQLKDNDDKSKDIVMDVSLDPIHTKINGRWKRVDGNQRVFVETNSVPASAVPLSADVLYCACANTLEVKGGSLRAEGLTLLPAGDMFYQLCRLTFGLECNKDLESHDLSSVSALKDPDEIKRRVKMATEFNLSSMNLGETLECFPDKVRELISIFDGVDGYESLPWENLNENPFLLKKMQMQIPDEFALALKDLHRRGQRQKKKSEELLLDGPKRHNEKQGCLARLDLSEKSLLQFSDLLFGRIPNSDNSDKSDLPSSTICGIVVGEARAKIFKKPIQVMNLNDLDWEISRIHINSEKWYLAKFLNSGLSYVHHKKAKKFPSWIQATDQVQPRPSNKVDALNCIPKFFAKTLSGQMRDFLIDDDNVLIFKTLFLAVQMEAAFWLERQFCSATKHWFELKDTKKMASILVAEHKKQTTLSHTISPSKTKGKNKRTLKKKDQVSATT